MEKRLVIEGLHCGQCLNTIEQALNAIEGVTAKVDLTGAEVSLNKSITDSALTRAVQEAGFTVTEVQDLIQRA